MNQFPDVFIDHTKWCQVLRNVPLPIENACAKTKLDKIPNHNPFVEPFFAISILCVLCESPAFSLNSNNEDQAPELVLSNLYQNANDIPGVLFILYIWFVNDVGNCK